LKHGVCEKTAIGGTDHCIAMATAEPHARARQGGHDRSGATRSESLTMPLKVIH
jgi:hypothetical protein